MILSHANRLPPRRGAILLVVMTLTALFAVVALSFALYSESAANSQRMVREAAATNDGPPASADIASQFIGRLIYPTDPLGANYGTTNDPTVGSLALLNALRGYDFSTMVYGYHPTAANATPYNGIGTVFEDLSTNPLLTSTSPPLAPALLPDRRLVVNYSWQQDLTTPTNSRVFDPEFLGVRANAAVGPNTTYVARNAPYTYPDRKDLYLAVQDPTTGKILRQSFVSSHFGGLQSTNPNWTNAQGRYMTIRPRPADHTFGGTQDFPFPPLDPDGIARGDVQNIPNIEGLQQNDAVWVNANLPVVQWRGKNIIPLIAPTILALDGRVNANVAGNMNMKSTNGFGPWEVNLGRITTDGSSMVSTRFNGGGTTPAPRGVTTSPYNYFYPPSTATATTSPPSYALVDWNGNATQKPFFPGDATDPDAATNPYKVNVAFPYSVPTPFTPSQFGEPGEASNNPAAFNPYAWNAFTQNAKLFSYPDLRRSSAKYSGRGSDYSPPYFGQSPPTTLTGTGPSNPSNQLRNLLTTTSNSVARPGLMPNFRDYTSAGRTVTYAPGIGLIATATVPQDQALQSPFATPPAGGANTNWVTDFSASAAATNVDQYRAAVAALGTVNLNRPLTDYRMNPSAPLADPSNSPPTTNAAAYAAAAQQMQQATVDRNQFAREIFARLIVATGAKAQVANATTIVLPTPTGPGAYSLTTTGGTTVAVQQGEYDALKFLAQMAANIVDFIDNDDVITAFVWNPITPTNPLYAVDPANFQPAELANRVVYGVEKPRLVINEVYSEVNNGPTQGGQPGPFHVNFWVETLNTSNNDQTTSPLAGPTSLGATAGSVPLQLNGASVYRIEVYEQGQTAVTELATSPRGDTTTPPVAQADAANFTNANPQFAQWVEPNNGAMIAQAGNRNGIAVFGPKQTGPTQPAIPNNPTLLTGNGGNGGQAGTNPPQSDLFYTSAFGRNPPTNAVHNNTVLLRRLMNPYLPADPTMNPYVTVDYMAHVYAEDGVETVQGNRPGTTRPHTNTQPNRRHSGGRVQPYTGQEAVAGGGPNARYATFPTSFVVEEQTTHTPTVPPRQLARTSLFQHNSQVDLTTTQPPAADSTLNRPFEWLVHLDRPLINQMELLHVAGCRNHELTHNFATPNAAGAPLFHQHLAFKQMLTAPATMPPLYRALELLTVKPWGYGLPDGGRVPGKININMVWDHRVLEALLDASAANSFQTTDVFNPASPNDRATTLWGKLMNTRTPNWDTNNVPQPGSTVDEGGTDRPFKPLGTASFTAGGMLPSGSGLQDTLLRDVNPSSPTGNPAVIGFTNTSTTRTYQASELPYQKAEMLRKMYNSVTTTSDTFLVVMTVGYFEVRNAGPYTTSNPPVLGKEVYSDVPTDMRSKFVAVVDRSMIAQAIDPTTGTTLNQQADRLFFTDVADGGTPQSIPANPGAAPLTNPPVTLTIHCNFDTNGTTPVLFYEGRRLTFGGTGPDAITAVALGTGPQAVAITNVAVSPAPGAANPAAGTVTLTGTAMLTLPANAPARPILPGTAVSSGVLANPGPQTNFDVNATQFKGVVPFFDRVTLGQ